MREEDAISFWRKGTAVKETSRGGLLIFGISSSKLGGLASHYSTSHPLLFLYLRRQMRLIIKGAARPSLIRPVILFKKSCITL